MGNKATISDYGKIWNMSSAALVGKGRLYTGAVTVTMSDFMTSYPNAQGKPVKLNELCPEVACIEGMSCPTSGEALVNFPQALTRLAVIILGIELTESIRNGSGDANHGNRGVIADMDKEVLFSEKL